MGAELFLVRHGETEGQSSIRYHGRTDVALSDLGRAQMRAAASALGSRGFTRIFASTMIRATEGARLIAGESGEPIEFLEEFVEVDFGLFEGLTAEEIRARYPAEFEQWDRDRLTSEYAYPGGESRAGFRARVERGLHRMLEMWDSERGDGPALLVAHRGVIRTIVRALVKVEPVIELGSIHILERAPQWRVRELDIVGHLDGIEAGAGNI